MSTRAVPEPTGCPRWGFLPIRLQGAVRAHGIRIADAAKFGQPGPLFIPWGQVNVEPNAAIIAGADGAPLLCGDRRVIVPLRTQRASTVARLAQRRSLTTAWNRGTLDLSEVIGPSRVDRITSIIVALMGSIAWLCLLMSVSLPAWRNVPTFPPAHQTLAYVTVLAIALVYLPLVLLVTAIAWRLTRCPKVSLHLSAAGLTISRLDRTDFYRWESLRKARCGLLGFKLRFDDGAALFLHRPRRTAVILRHWDAVHGDGRCAAPGQITPALRFRLLLWCLTGGLVGAAIVNYLQSQGLGGPRSPLAVFAAIGFGLPALMLSEVAVRAWSGRRGNRRFRPPAWLRAKAKATNQR